ncbi:MAG: MFS transporter [Gammaproteobacteria bacterium]|nr:MFS transporter [Gammaproteobacteria bacterium]
MSTNSTSDNRANKTTLESVYLALTSEDDGRLCKDIPESACNDQPKHFLSHVISLTSSKSADSLIDPKLILAWLFTQLGASAFIVGLLVPIREAGALLPQLFIANWVRQRSQRKWVWAIGSAIQGMCVIGMVVAIMSLDQEDAVYVLLGLVSVLALARSFCSVSYKDVLGKTVSKSTRGTATGLATSLAAITILTFAILISFSIVTLSIDIILILLTIAGLLWLFAAINFLSLTEHSGATEGGASAIHGLAQRVRRAFQDNQFSLFIATRACLVTSTLAPPFILLLQQQLNTKQQLITSNTALEEISSSLNLGSDLGLLILASALASLFSSYIWGRLADRSSRKVLIFAACTSALMYAVITIGLLTEASFLTEPFAVPLILFVIMVAYQGVNLGRSTHLVDMAPEEKRADYTAVSNTVIGLVLTLGSLFGWLAQSYGLVVLFSIFFLLASLAAIIATRLSEVQQTE